jgi:ElaB/YqjD/DUF883 family membrane-anchored ribosome-binding protein
MAESRKIEEEAKAAVEPMMAEIATMRAELAELGSHVAGITKRRAAGIKSAASATASQGYAKGEEALDVVLAELQSLEGELADATRRKPFAALGLAALVGFLFGVLFRR